MYMYMSVYTCRCQSRLNRFTHAYTHCSLLYSRSCTTHITHTRTSHNTDTHTIYTTYTCTSHTTYTCTPHTPHTHPHHIHHIHMHTTYTCTHTPHMYPLTHKRNRNILTATSSKSQRVYQTHLPSQRPLSSHQETRIHVAAH